jgi:hypothetical protein
MTKEKKPGKALVNWEEKFAGLAKDSMKGIALPTAKWLSIKSGVLSYGGAEVPDNELRCIVVGWTFENQLYEGRFDPNNPSSPVCYAFGTDPDEMVPHEKSADPKNDACATCPLNEYESDPKGGKGKACKNVVRLALIAESDLADLSAAEVVYLKVPVTSVKNFKYYAAKTLQKDLQRPLWSVLTLLSVEPDESNAVKVNFSFIEKLEENDAFNDEVFETLEKLFEGTMEEIGFPYAANSERAERAPAVGRGKVAKGAKVPPSKPQKFARK